MNGDLFDFWFEWKTVIPRRGFRTLAALADLHDAVPRSCIIAGNHDCWGADVLRDDVGVDYHVGAWRGDIGSWRTVIEHGDGLREAEDRKYRMVRPIMRIATRHPHVPRASSGSRHAHRDGQLASEQNVQRARRRRGPRSIAHARLATDSTTDLVIFGHSHVAALERTRERTESSRMRAHGSTRRPISSSATAIELREWDGSAEGKRLDVIDRAAEK